MAELVGVRAQKISSTDPDLYLAIGDVQLAKGAADKAAAHQKALEASAGVPAPGPGGSLRDEDSAAAEAPPARSPTGRERRGPLTWAWRTGDSGSRTRRSPSTRPKAPARAGRHP
jgi:hypothetical protein